MLSDVPEVLRPFADEWLLWRAEGCTQRWHLWCANWCATRRKQLTRFERNFPQAERTLLRANPEELAKALKGQAQISELAKELALACGSAL